MKVLVLGDLHIHNHKAMGGPVEAGLNRRCMEILLAVSIACRAAREDHGCEAVVQLGDFFDVARPPAAVVDAALTMIRQSGMPWHVLAGNHDVSAYDAPTAVAPLGHVPGIRVYEKTEVISLGGVEWVMVPYTGPSALAAWKSVAGLVDVKNLPRVHCFHYGFTGFAGGAEREDLVQSKWTLPAHGTFLFGHEHSSDASGNASGREFYSLGSFSDFDFGEGSSIVHRCAIVDTHQPVGQSVTLHQTPGPVFVGGHGPEPANLRLDNQAMMHGIFGEMDPVAVYARVTPDLEPLARMYKKAGMLTDYVVVPIGAIEEDDGSSLPPAGVDPMAFVRSAALDMTTDPDLGEVLDVCEELLRQ